MERIDVCDGWSVEYDAPTLSILEGEAVVFTSDEWNPNMSDPREDALFWASAIADPHSGLEAEPEDDSAFAAGVRYVREHAPSLFADECSLMAQEVEP